MHDGAIGLVYFGLACDDSALGMDAGVNRQTGDC
jgi:hypothetical protein